MEHTGGQIAGSDSLRVGRNTLNQALSLVDNSFDSIPLDRQARLLKELVLQKHFSKGFTMAHYF